MSEDVKSGPVATSCGNVEAAEDYPLSEVPLSARAGLISLNAVLLGFTFFTATMFGGGKVGVAFRFWPDLIFVALAGNLLLGAYVAALGWIAIVSSFIAFFLGNGLMIFSGAFGALVYQEPDVVQVLAGQGILLGGLFLLFFNIWTTQDNTIYNFSVAGCNLLRTERRRRFTLGGAALGTVIALLGMYDWLVPYLLFLGTAIPPLGGAIMADFWFRRRRDGYPPVASAVLPRWNIAGLLAYAGGVAAAALSPGVAPLNGILAAFFIYGVATILGRRPAAA